MRYLTTITAIMSLAIGSYALSGCAEENAPEPYDNSQKTSPSMSSQDDTTDSNAADRQAVNPPDKNKPDGDQPM